jgi:integrase
MNVIKDFVGRANSKSSKDTRKTVMNSYFKIIRCNPDKYIKSNRDFERDILTFMQSLEHYSAMTKYNYKSVVRQFMYTYDIEIRGKFWGELAKRYKKKITTDDRIATKAELREIITHADLKNKAMVLVLCTSGMRIGELCSIDVSDIDMNTEPTTITIHAMYTKSKIKRVTFITKEATNVLKLWLKIREDYLRTAVKHCESIKIKKDIHDTRVFPFNTFSARKSFNLVLEKAGYGVTDKFTRFHKYRFHNLRKFFKTNAVISGMPLPMIDKIIGHQGYLPEYVPFSDEQLRTEYAKKIEPSFVIFESAVDHEMVEHLSKEVDRLHEKTVEHDAFLDGLDKEKLIRLLMALNGDDTKAIWDKIETFPKEFVRTIPEKKKRK